MSDTRSLILWIIHGSTECQHSLGHCHQPQESLQKMVSISLLHFYRHPRILAFWLLWRSKCWEEGRADQLRHYRHFTRVRLQQRLCTQVSTDEQAQLSDQHILSPTQKQKEGVHPKIRKRGKMCEQVFWDQQWEAGVDWSPHELWAL